MVAALSKNGRAVIHLRKLVWLGLGVVGCLLAASAWKLLSDPLRLPQAVIEAHLLELTPLGTSSIRAAGVIRQEGWNTYQQDWPPLPPGMTTIKAQLGGYQGLPWYVYVRGIWYFDRDGRLVKVEVEKIFDSP
jgi:hypothetical protein